MVWLRVARPHILAIVFMSTLTYGLIFTDGFHLLIPLIAVWDWFIVNFNNKAVDIEEDLKNRIPGAAQVQANKRLVEGLSFLMIAVGLLGGLVWMPQILPFRVAFTVIGLGYNYRFIPVLQRKGTGWSIGRSRFKEMYFFKNFGSSMLFTLSVFMYPLFGLGAQHSYPLSKLLLMIGFFIPLELTYEIFYDLRDLEGDRAQKVPTYPVVHGRAVAIRIIYALILASGVFVLVGALFADFRVREWCVLAANLQQALLVRHFLRDERLPSQSESEFVTWMGAAQLGSFCLWLALGLPLGA